MSKLLVAITMVLATIQPAFATPATSELDIAQLEAIQNQDLEAHQLRGGAIVGGVVGGIIGGVIGGLISADQMERYPQRYRRVVCYAESFRGQRFQAVGNRARQAQRQALNKCYRFARNCRALGCHSR